MSEAVLDSVTIDVRKRRDIPEEVAKSVCLDALLVYERSGITPSQLHADGLTAQIELLRLKNRQTTIKDVHRIEINPDTDYGPMALCQNQEGKVIAAYPVKLPVAECPPEDEDRGLRSAQTTPRRASQNPSPQASPSRGEGAEDIAAEEGGHGTPGNLSAETRHPDDPTFTDSMWAKVCEAVSNHNNARPSQRIQVVETLDKVGIRKGWWILPENQPVNLEKVPLGRNGKSTQDGVIGPIPNLSSVFHRIDQFNCGRRSTMDDIDPAPAE